MIQKILSFAGERIASGQRVAWVTVMKTHGSSPASAGQVMVVAEDGKTAGTIGGGASEHSVAQRALGAMAASEATFSLAIDHAQDCMVCGGGMEVTGTILGQQARLVIFGGGHIAQALAPMAASTGFSVAVVEDRAEFAADFEEARYIICLPEAYREKVAIAPADYVVICTRGHATDDAALRYSLGQRPAYIGMIGSRRKVATLMEQLRQEGFSEAQLSKVYAPIGLAIATEKPAEIAVAILAEILLVKNNGQTGHLRDAGIQEHNG